MNWVGLALITGIALVVTVLALRPWDRRPDRETAWLMALLEDQGRDIDIKLERQTVQIQKLRARAQELLAELNRAPSR